MTLPCAMYTRGSYAGQIDHPGWLSKVVRTETEYADAVADGWGPVMVDPVGVPAPPDAPSSPFEPAPDDSDSLGSARHVYPGWREPSQKPRGRLRKVAE